MINFVNQRHLMQTDVDFVAESGESKFELNVAAGVGATIFALFLLIVIYKGIQKCRESNIERKFKKWTPYDRDLKEFSSRKLQPGNRSPIHVAIQVGNEVLARNLIQKDFLFGIEIDAERCTALHYAAKFGTLSLVVSISEKMDGPLTQDIHGNTALHYAATRGDIAILTYLARKFKEAQTVRNGSGASYLKCLAVTWKGNYEEVLCDPKDFVPFIEQNRDIIPEGLFVGLLAPYRTWGVEYLTVDISEIEEVPLL